MPGSSIPISRRHALRSFAAAGALLVVTPPIAGANGSSGALASTDEELDYIQSHLGRMTLEEKVGQLFVIQVYGAGANQVSPAHAATNQRAYGVDSPAQIVGKYKLGGVIYFNFTGNVENPRQVAQLSNGLQAAALQNGGPPLIIATDQETGIVVRLGPPATQFPGAQALAAGGKTAEALVAAKITGRELRAVGINQNFSPVADVNVNAENPVIGVRSFSSDPDIAAEFVKAQVHGYQQGSAGVAAAAKHFPGHGDTKTDSHFGLPSIDHTLEEWETTDAPPFKAAIASGIDVIMTAHIVVESLDPSGVPATISEPILTGILRQRLGYDGIIITDALNMKALRDGFGPDRIPVLAVKAGVDQLLVPLEGEMDVMYQSVLAAVRAGEISEDRLDQSVTRILRLKWRRGMVEEPMVDVATVDRVVGNRTSINIAERITDSTITALRNENAAGEAILPVQPTGTSVFVAAGITAAGNDLAAALRDRGATVDVAATGTRPSDAAIANAVTQAGTHDLTVVITSKAWDVTTTDPQGRQRRLVAALADTGRPVVVIAARDIYDIAYLPESAAFLGAYSSTTVSMRSVARVITGEISPRGHVPVVVPAADGSVLYPIGHGLTWSTL